MINVEDHLGLVNHILKKYHAPYGIEIDDWYQTGCIGLFKASQTFDKDKSPYFSSWAAKCIYNELKLFHRDHRNKKNSFHSSFVSLDMPVKNAEEDIAVLDTVRSMWNVEEIAVANELESYITTKSDVVNSKLATVSKMVIQGYTTNEIGKEIAMSRSTSLKRIYKIRKIVRDYYSV